MEAADVLALFKVEVVLKSVAINFNVGVLGGILGSAGSQTVQTERVFIVSAFVVFVLTARVKLAVNKLPVIALLRVVVVNGTAASEVLHFHGTVLIIGNDYLVAVSIAGFINRV